MGVASFSEIFFPILLLRSRKKIENTKPPLLYCLIYTFTKQLYRMQKREHALKFDEYWCAVAEHLQVNKL